MAPHRGLAIERHDAVVRLRLDRPRDGNRITPDVAQRFVEAAEDIALADDVRVVVVEATGEAFCLGVAPAFEGVMRVPWVEALAALAAPLVAIIQGDAVAEGCELVLACDLRVAAASAHFSLPQICTGTIPSHGATQRLPRIIGRTRAMDLLLSGRSVDATEAAAMGLVTQVVPGNALAEASSAAIAELAGKAPLALRYAKEAVLNGLDMTLGQGIRLEEDLYALLQTTTDRAEGVRAFLEKRPPDFRGR